MRATAPPASANQDRDSRFQAVLAMWGKMLNVEKARSDKIYKNDKTPAGHQRHWAPVSATISSWKSIPLPQGHHHGRCRCDGSHIRTLLLTFFFRYMRHCSSKTATSTSAVAAAV